MSFTFTTKHASDYKPVSFPAGFYRGVVTACFADTSKSSGQPMLVARLLIRSSDGVQDLELTHYMPSSVEWKLEQFCVACGLEFKEGQTVSFEPASMIGKHVTVRTHMEPGTNDASRLFARISGVMPRGSEPHLGAMTPEELGAYGLEQDGRLAPRKPRTNYGQQQPQQQNDERQGVMAPYQEPTMADDDIPF